MQYTQLQRAMAGAHRVFEILDTQPVILEQKKPIKLDEVSQIIFDNVSFSYEAEQQVLTDINLNITQGETLALVGPTGSGKTTIISLLSRLYEVTSGKILINKHEIKEISLQSLRNQIGLVFQEPFLFSGTIYENI